VTVDTITVVKPTDDDRRREKVYRLLIVVLVGVLVATWVAVVWLIQGKNTAQDDAAKAEKDTAQYAAGPDAQAAAERILGQMISYDYRNMDDEYVWTKYLGNDDLRKDYVEKIVPGFRKLVRSTQATADGKIVQSAYNIVGDDQVVVLAFIRQKLTDKDHQDGLIAEQWASLTMVPDHDEGWLIDKVDIVSVPPPS
jgi:hypothetical protein